MGLTRMVRKGTGMWCAIYRSGRVLALVGVMAVSGSMASGESGSETTLHFACLTSAQVDEDRLSDICTDFRDLLQAQPGLRVLDPNESGRADAPGLEIDVTRATDTQLELVPTWIAKSGERTTLPSAGLVIADTAMTKTMRRNLFLQVLASSPK